MIFEALIYHSLGSMNWFENCTTVQKGLRLTGGVTKEANKHNGMCFGGEFRGAQSQMA